MEGLSGMTCKIELFFLISVVLVCSCKTLDSNSAYLMTSSYGTEQSHLFIQNEPSCQDALSGIEKVYNIKNYDEKLGIGLAVLTKTSNLYTGGEFAIDTPLAPDDSLSEIKLVATTDQAFAAVRKDGTLLSWGNKEYGGDSSSVAEELHDIVSIKATGSAFSVIRKDGSVIAWGKYGGRIPPRVKNRLQKVKKLVSNERAFVAMIRDKKIKKSLGSKYKYTYKLLTWGDPGFGGNSEDVEEDIASDVVEVIPTERAFAALKLDGSVVTWGNDEFGGDSSKVSDELIGVDSIVSNHSAFVARKVNGDLVAWGNEDHGGKLPVSQYLNDIKQIIPSWRAFTVLRKDGRILSWGSDYFGGDISPLGKKVNGIKEVCATNSNFVALRKDGSVVVWGDDNLVNSSKEVAENLTEGVKKIMCSYSAAVAIRRDGVLVAWSNINDGDEEYIYNTVAVNLKKIYPLLDDFLYTTKDGKISTVLYGGKKLGLSCSKE